nr:MAG TPA: hypothetical protein [Caudoviricetes sp.]DAW62382.1 MAG TPA: hypothetical protein [Caudoviricetes sp.]
MLYNLLFYSGIRCSFLALCRLINVVVSYAHKPVKLSEYFALNYPVLFCAVLFFPVFYFSCLFYRHINVGSLPLLHS